MKKHKFPFYQQLDKSDCGPSCLRMIAKYHGKYFTAETMRDKSFLSKGGTTLYGLKQAAESIGMETYAFKLTWEQLIEAKKPCIVHWNSNHYVVIFRIDKKKNNNYRITVADPAFGSSYFDKSTFLRKWAINNLNDTGIVLCLSLTERFFTIEEDSDTTLSWIGLLSYLKPFKQKITKFIVALLIGSLVNLAFPFLTQAVVDKGIHNKDLDLILLLLIAQLLLTFGQFAVDMVRSWLMLHITMQMSISIISDFLSKLVKLPISFFDVKKVGDIMQRVNDNSRIQSFLTGSLVSILVASISFLIYAVVMAGYNLKILALFFGGSILYIIWVFLFLSKRKRLDRIRFQNSSSSQSNLIQLMGGMQEIKLNNCAELKLDAWKQIQEEIYKTSIKSKVLEQTQSTGALFIDQIKNIVISYFAARLVVDGKMTLGMMMGMQYVMGQLNAPLKQFIGFVQSFQDAQISLERMGEIYNKNDEEQVSSSRIKEIPRMENIVFKDVSFQYEGPKSKKVLDNVTFEIQAGKVNAIVGPSGSGKTTILKLLLGYYKPVEGQIMLGNISFHKFNINAWRENCGTVMQDGYIFSDTIERNINLKDVVTNQDLLRYAVYVSNIKEVIESLPSGYNTKIGIDGTGLSSGQRQRILMARAVYRNPQYIFFDEATNSLDSINEHLISERLQSFYNDRTVVVIAHRLSTIKNADNIIVLQNGEVVETGNHSELLAKNGPYFNLIENQLENIL